MPGWLLLSVIACMSACIIFDAAATAYGAGRYTAREFEKKAGITKSQYRIDRWKYRGILSGLVYLGRTGGVAALTFDNYFIGI